MNTDLIFAKLSIGQIVVCIDFHECEYEGELLSFDKDYKFIILKFPASNGKPSYCDIRFFNLNFVKDIRILREPSSEVLPLPGFNFSKLSTRVKNNSDAKMKQVEYLGVGVTPLAQKLLNSITKIITEVYWEGSSIVVMDEVKISPPYFPSDCHGPDGSQALHLVKNLVEKFHREKEKLASSDCELTFCHGTS